MNCKELFEKIDELNNKYISVLEDICNIESPTDYKAGVDAVGKYISDMASERGWKVEVLKQDVAGDLVCITLNPDAQKPPITLSGHIDTVHPVGSFGTPAVRIVDDRMYGPGVVDCKGGIVAALLAMDALYLCGFNDRPVRLLLQTDEETGSSTSGRATINYMCDSSKDSVAFLNLEGMGDNNKVCIHRKGIANFTFAVHGKEAHSANCTKSGANAILEAAHKIIELEKLKDHDGVTCNCGVISGGTVPNTVPGYCEFKANVRFATTEQLEWVKDYMQKVADTVYVNGCASSVTLTRLRIAMEYCERNQKLFDAFNELFEREELSPIVPHFGLGGSDAAEITAAGIPCLDSFGIKGGACHSPNEYGLLSSLSDSAKRIALSYFL